MSFHHMPLCVILLVVYCYAITVVVFVQNRGCHANTNDLSTPAWKWMHTNCIGAMGGDRSRPTSTPVTVANGRGAFEQPPFTDAHYTILTSTTMMIMG